jgi:hypothetical protein
MCPSTFVLIESKVIESKVGTLIGASTKLCLKTNDRELGWCRPWVRSVIVPTDSRVARVISPSWSFTCYIGANPEQRWFYILYPDDIITTHSSLLSWGNPFAFIWSLRGFIWVVQYIHESWTRKLNTLMTGQLHQLQGLVLRFSILLSGVARRSWACIKTSQRQNTLRWLVWKCNNTIKCVLCNNAKVGFTGQHPRLSGSQMVGWTRILIIYEPLRQFW